MLQAGADHGVGGGLGIEITHDADANGHKVLQCMVWPFVAVRRLELVTVEPEADVLPHFIAFTSEREWTSAVGS